MKWFGDRWSLFWAAYTRHPWVLGAAFVVCGLVGTSPYLLKLVSDLSGEAGIEIFNTQVPLFPVLGIVSLCVAAVWMLLEGSAELKRAVTPTIEVLFNPEREGIIRTPLWVTSQKGDTVEVGEDQSVYVSVTANVISKTTVKNIVGFVTKIEKKTTGAFEDIPVYGYIKLGDPGDAYPRVPTVMNVVRTRKSTGTLEFVQPGPLTLRDVFKDPATYRFTIEVSGDGVTETIRVEVDWNGKWDGITARRA